MFRSLGRLPSEIPWQPELPTGRVIHLPGRGEVFIRSADGPDGSTPVLLLHGVSWSADINYFALFGPLSRSHTAIAMDQRGHGRGLPLTRRVSTSMLADDAVAVLDELGIEKAIIAGFSLGTFVAQKVGVRHPDRVAGLVLSAGALCLHETARDKALMAATPTFRALARRGAFASMSARYFAPVLKRGDEAFLERWPWLRHELAATPPEAIATAILGVARHDLRGKVTSLRSIPSATVIHTRDTLIVPKLQRRLADELGSDVLLLPHDHAAAVTHPDAFVKVMLEAISRVDARARSRTANERSS